MDIAGSEIKVIALEHKVSRWENTVGLKMIAHSTEPSGYVYVFPFSIFFKTIQY